MDKIKTIKDMKIFIRKYADDLKIENKKAILQMLKSKIDNSKIKEVSDGIRINLDILDDDVISSLNYMIEYKLKEECN